MDFRSLHLSYPTEFAKQSKQNHHGFYEIKRIVPNTKRENIDHLFQSFVLPKISYGLPVYAASVPEHNIL